MAVKPHLPLLSARAGPWELGPNGPRKPQHIRKMCRSGCSDLCVYSQHSGELFTWAPWVSGTAELTLSVWITFPLESLFLQGHKASCMWSGFLTLSITHGITYPVGSRTVHMGDRNLKLKCPWNGWMSTWLRAGESDDKHPQKPRLLQAALSPTKSTRPVCLSMLSILTRFYV